MSSNYPRTSSSATPSITAVHQDIIQTHILTRLDGPTLAATSCASSQLHALSTLDKLWRQICTTTWPSINDEHVRHVISSFPTGHRSFFSDVFPVLDCKLPSKRCTPTALITTELIFCVDVYYSNALIISKNLVIETVTSWFHCSPFRVDLFDSKESVLTPILHGAVGDTWLKDLEDKLTLSWILIDSSKKRAVNLSSGSAVKVEKRWLTGDIQVRFGTIMVIDNGRLGSPEMEYVKCEVVVTCGEEDGGGVLVREVSMQVEDMDGRVLSGRNSLGILQEAMEKGRKKGGGEGRNGKERYEEFVERKRKRKEKKDKKERALDMVCVCFGVTVFVAFWSFILLV